MKKKILITGANGFLGKALCNYYNNIYEYTVTSVGSYKQKDCHFNVDLTWWDDAFFVIKETKPDIIIHCAAVIGGIVANKENPGRFIYENLQMGLNMIESARLMKVGKFVNIGTICSYPENAEVPFDEGDLWNGYPTPITAPYGIAKKTLHDVLMAYYDQYQFNGITVMPTNIYGPGDHFRGENTHVVAALIDKIYKTPDGETLELLGDGTATRELIYIDDCVNAIDLCVEKYDAWNPINIGTGFEISIRDLAILIRNVMNKHIDIKFNGDRNMNGAQRRCLNVDKLRNLGFEYKTKLRYGILRTIEDYKERYARNL